MTSGYTGICASWDLQSYFLLSDFYFYILLLLNLKLKPKHIIHFYCILQYDYVYTWYPSVFTLEIKMSVLFLFLCVCLGMCMYVQMAAGSHLRCMPSSYLCRTVSDTLEVGDYARLTRQQVTVIYPLDLARSGLQALDSLPLQVLMLIKQVLYQLSYIPSSVTVRFAPISKQVFFFSLSTAIGKITSSVWSLTDWM